MTLDGQNGLLGQFTKCFPETALNEAMTERLGHEHGVSNATNVTNAIRLRKSRGF
ncbi:hypothetical protein [Cryobacterium luteum]|uniref:hypothetical protein n=1 Tax=Cryobacterium luteum TaxID=1424661 RepID=UPI00141B03B0|nr:hypothetical protein [Cryobacterium luteum]